MRSYYKPGSWNAICDLCGFKFKAEQLQLRWDGARVCEKDWEPRHPSDFIRIPRETARPSWVRPEQDTFISADLTTEAAENLLTEDGNNLIW